MIQTIGDVTMFLECFSVFFVIFQIDFCLKTRERLFGLFICISIWLIGIIAGVTWRDLLIGPFPLFLVVVFTILYFIFDISIAETITMGIGAWLILSILEEIPCLFVRQLKYEKSIEVVLTMMITVVSIWLLRLVLGRKIEGVLPRLPVRMWILFDLILFVITAMLTFFSFVLTRLLENEHRVFMGQMLSAFGGALILLLFFAMLYCYNEMNSYRIQKEMAEEHNEQQREYFMRMLEKEDETRRFRHDIIDDLNAMQFYCKKRKYEQLESYLENTLGTIQSIRDNDYDVGNDIINIVLNYYLRPLKGQYDISVSGYVSDDISINPRDLCVLSANLIKNASEAVCKLQNGIIKVGIDHGKTYMIMKVENSFDGSILVGRRVGIKTSKADKKNHGIGIANIKEIVKKYDGIYLSEVGHDVFCTEVYIKCDR